MKRIARIISIVGLTAAISCAPVKVVTDRDQSVDFSTCQAFSFLGWQDGSDALMNEFEKKRVRDAFIAEFDTRGFTYVEEGADMEISLFVVLDQKTSVSSYTDYYGSGGYGYRRYGGWGTGHARTVFTENDYTQGTLVMDAFDSGTKDQIWQAVASGMVAEDPNKRDRNIPVSVNKLMSKSPVEPLA